MPEIAARYDARPSEAACEIPPNYNVAPTDPLPILVTVWRQRRIEAARWGILPVWAKPAANDGVRRGGLLFNIRAETAGSRYRRALLERRCAVVVDGFYEWSGPREKVRGKSQRLPWFVAPRNHKTLALAGLWASTPEGVEVAVLTTTPNLVMAPLHDRMPACLDDEQLAVWLDPSFSSPSDADVLTAALGPAPDEYIEVHRVGTAVNSSRATGAQLCEPFAEPDAPATLF